jgi:hypothetical protein
MIAALVYVLCALTSTLCAVMLLANYRSSRTRLLFWSALGFLGMALNNILLVLDVLVVPHLDLSIVRTLPAVLGVCVWVWGFVWDTQ